MQIREKKIGNFSILPHSFGTDWEEGDFPNWKIPKRGKVTL
jgi:hypothetical protein